MGFFDAAEVKIVSISAASEPLGGIMKRLVAAIALLVILSAAALAQQDYPNRIIKILQGFPPGGNVDIIVVAK